DAAHQGAGRLKGAREAAIAVADRFKGRHFRLAPGGEPLIDPEGVPSSGFGLRATRQAVLDGLGDEDLTLWISMTHGNRPDEGRTGAEYLCLSGNDRLYPQEVACLKLPGTIVDHAACVVGTSRGRGGGRFDSHPNAALVAGASCVLASVHSIFDDKAAHL